MTALESVLGPSIADDLVAAGGVKMTFFNVIKGSKVLVSYPSNGAVCISRHRLLLVLLAKAQLRDNITLHCGYKLRDISFDDKTLIFEAQQSSGRQQPFHLPSTNTREDSNSHASASHQQGTQVHQEQQHPVYETDDPEGSISWDRRDQPLTRVSNRSFTAPPSPPQHPSSADEPITEDQTPTLLKHVTVRAQHLYGCDGVNSVVRRVMARDHVDGFTCTERDSDLVLRIIRTKEGLKHLSRDQYYLFLSDPTIIFSPKGDHGHMGIPVVCCVCVCVCGWTTLQHSIPLMPPSLSLSISLSLIM